MLIDQATQTDPSCLTESRNHENTINELNLTIERLSRKLKRLEFQLKESKFNIENYKDKPSDISFYTGLYDYETLRKGWKP